MQTICLGVAECQLATKAFLQLWRVFPGNWPSRSPRPPSLQSLPATTPTKSLPFTVKDTNVEIIAERPPESNRPFPGDLPHPPFQEISRAALKALDPDLKGVVLQVIHDTLKLLGPKLVYTSLAAYSSSFFLDCFLSLRLRRRTPNAIVFKVK